MSDGAASLTPLLAGILEEQASLKTPVAEFSDWHEREDSEPLQARHYKKLIPLSTPGPGEQYAFEVNLDQCTGCKACVAACHSLNGLDEDESWRDVGSLLGFAGEHQYVQTVTSACHHCEEPACSHGCPVLAYDKDPHTGIVRHLDDQCIGCSYCVMKCPYDVPKYNEARGIVRKCDMCHDRLAVGEAPACVQACPSEAISIRVVKQGREFSQGVSLIPGAFPSDYTVPTTRYVSSQPIPAAAQPADAGRVRRDVSHGPLAWMLVLTQMGAGIFLFGAMSALSTDGKLAASITGAAVTFLGMTLSLLHLGQPLKAWRAFLGWRRSWLSREIIAFGIFGKATLLPLIVWLLVGDTLWLSAAMGMAALAGAVAIACSVMVYVDTRRPFWILGRVSLQFVGTVAVLGAGSIAVGVPFFGIVSAVAATLLLIADVWSQRQALSDRSSPLHAPARVMRELLAKQTETRRVLLGVAAVCFFIGAVASLKFVLALALCSAFAALVIGRHHFFTACSGPRMTGS